MAALAAIVSLQCLSAQTAQTPRQAGAMSEQMAAYMERLRAEQELVKSLYTKTEVMIPMRDGTRLYTAIYEPKNAGPRPIIMERTCYGAGPAGETFSSSVRPGNVYFDNNYIFVFQDVRGKENSEGDFVQETPYNLNANHGAPNGNTEFDEATDTYDTVEWLVNNTNNNGNVGIMGVSYVGFYATMGALCNHPAMKAASPQAPCTDWWKGDDVHHNGAFMMLDLYNFGKSFFLDREANETDPYRSPSRIQGNAYDYFLKLGSTKGMLNDIADPVTLREKYDFWEDIIDHPNYDEYWKTLDPLQHCYNIKPAVMVVGGSYDGEDCWGAVNTYKAIAAQSPQTESYFVYGPWPHGYWSSKSYTGFGGISFGEGIGDWYTNEIEYKFFAHYLEGKDEKPAKVNIVPGFNDKNHQWTYNTYDHWPLKYEEVSLYLNKGWTAGYSKPTMHNSYDRYISDPKNPVPYTEKQKMGGMKTYVVESQDFVAGREDVMCYFTDPVKQTTYFAGPVKADIWLSTTGSDLDLIVKVVDMAPDGTQMTIKSDVFRCRYNKSISNPSFIKKNQMTNIKFEMPDVAHYLLPGHYMMVQIQSSWFPLVDINPQTAVANIYEADASDYKSQRVKIYHDRYYPSRIILPVVK